MPLFLKKNIILLIHKSQGIRHIINYQCLIVKRKMFYIKQLFCNVLKVVIFLPRLKKAFCHHMKCYFPMINPVRLLDSWLVGR